MSTIEAMRMFCDGRMSQYDVRALLMSMGHSFEDCTAAFVALSGEAGGSIRFSPYHKGEYQADIFLTAQQ